jgi:hypothetical protein
MKIKLFMVHSRRASSKNPSPRSSRLCGLMARFRSTAAAPPINDLASPCRQPRRLAIGDRLLLPLACSMFSVRCSMFPHLGSAALCVPLRSPRLCVKIASAVPAFSGWLSHPHSCLHVFASMFWPQMLSAPFSRHLAYLARLPSFSLPPTRVNLTISDQI